MTAARPEDIPVLFLEALNSGDAGAVALLYEPEAVVAPEPDQAVAGRDAIQSMLAAFLSGQPHFELHDSEVVEAGGLALVRSRWTITMAGALEMRIGPTLVARRQPDGTWLVVIDRPLPLG